MTSVRGHVFPVCTRKSGHLWPVDAKRAGGPPGSRPCVARGRETDPIPVCRAVVCGPAAPNGPSSRPTGDHLWHPRARREASGVRRGCALVSAAGETADTRHSMVEVQLQLHREATSGCFAAREATDPRLWMTGRRSSGDFWLLRRSRGPAAPCFTAYHGIYQPRPAA